MLSLYVSSYLSKEALELDHTFLGGGVIVLASAKGGDTTPKITLVGVTHSRFWVRSGLIVALLCTLALHVQEKPN